MKNLISKSFQLITAILVSVLTTLAFNGVISILVALVFNGNFFRVYHSEGMQCISVVFFLVYTIIVLNYLFNRKK